VEKHNNMNTKEDSSLICKPLIQTMKKRRDSSQDKWLTPMWINLPQQWPILRHFLFLWLFPWSRYSIPFKGTILPHFLLAWADCYTTPSYTHCPTCMSISKPPSLHPGDSDSKILWWNTGILHHHTVSEYRRSWLQSSPP